MRTRSPARALVVTASLLITALPIEHAQSEPQNPLDALEADEIVQAAVILRTNGHVDDQTPVF